VAAEGSDVDDFMLFFITIRLGWGGVGNDYPI
jgi:hypothetical protein